MSDIQERLSHMAEDPMVKDLTADESMRRRILLKAAEKPEKKSGIRFAPILASAAAVALIVFSLIHFSGPGTPPVTMVSSDADTVVEEALLTSQSAGSGTAAKRPAEAEVQASTEIRNGTVQMGNTSPGGAGIWDTSAGNAALLGVNGRFYRLLSDPAVFQDSLKGSLLGAVNAFVQEPALSSGNILSNIAPEGTNVYSVRGADNAMVCADINGSLRAFQRVSYAGNAIMGRESLGDCLPSASVVSMEWKGVGYVDGQEARTLYALLLQDAIYQNGSFSDSGDYLVITYSGGLKVQLALRDEKCSACGTWACPAFLEAFRAEINH